jgi:acyl-CoA dehydrogenase
MILKLARKMLPTISHTERVALRSGTVGVDGNLFAGNMSQKLLLKYKPCILTEKDKVMLERGKGLVPLIDESEILRDGEMKPDHPFWDFAKNNGFFGVNISEEYGGQPMSVAGQSRLFQRISSISGAASVHTMVPNSLGPAELLQHYGTDEQKDKYLPKLANGMIPCFGLTGPTSGSDAAGSMKDIGEVFRDSDGAIKIRVTCNKRYITLAPVAELIGVAFKLEDKNNLLNLDKSHENITLALIERGTPGLEIGTRHDPLGIGFQNGPFRGTFDIEIDQVIGGMDGLGQGWKMLMECLAAGRGVSLPAGAAGCSKMLALTTGGYSMMRRQFKLPIGKFEGVREKLAEMVLGTLEIDSMVNLMNSTLDAGEKPAVLSAVLKYRTTETSRDVLQQAMDIVAGGAICRGPQNFVASAYAANPVSITVEGSNTLTRSMIIFGQGINKSHPYIADIVDSVDNPKEFYPLLTKIVKMNLHNFAVGSSEPLEKWCKFFSLSANASLLLGGKLKKMEYLSGRYADLLCNLYYGFALCWHAENQDLPEKLVKIALKDLEHRMQRTSDELIANHPHGNLHRLLRFRHLGLKNKPGITDQDRDYLAAQVTEGSRLRDLWSEDIMVGGNASLINERFLNPTEEEIDRVIQVDEF